MVVGRQFRRFGHHLGHDRLRLRQQNRGLGLDAAPIGEAIEPCPFDRGERDGGHERQALHHQHEGKNVDLVDLLVIGDDKRHARRPAAGRAITASQNAGKSGPLREHAALGGAQERHALLDHAHADGARDRPLHRHGRADRAEHLTGRCPHPQPVERSEMGDRDGESRDDRDRQDAIRHRDIGERDHRHPEDVQQRDHDADRVGADPGKPADAVFAFLLAREPGRARAACRASACAAAGSRRKPSDGAAAYRHRRCRAAGRGRSAGWCNAQVQPCSSMARPRSVSSTMVSLDQPPALSIAVAPDQAHRAVHDDGVDLVPLHHADVEEAGIFRVHGVVHQRTVAVAVVLRRLHEADPGVGEQRHQVFQPVRQRRRNRRRCWR